MRRNKRERNPMMSARKAATRTVQVSLDNIEDLLSVALEQFFRSTKVLKNSDVVEKIDVLMFPPWKGETVDVQIRLAPRKKKEVEHIIYNGA
jgi:hypothetical protein